MSFIEDNEAAAQTVFPAMRLLHAIRDNWNEGGSCPETRLTAAAQALGYSYIAQCRPERDGRPSSDPLTSAILEEFIVSNYPVPALQMITPLDFVFRFDARELVDSIGRGIGDARSGDNSWLTAMATALSSLRPNVCVVDQNDSFESFLWKKAASAILGSQMKRSVFPGTLTELPGVSGISELSIGHVLALGGCDVSRITNVAQYWLSRSGKHSVWWEDVLRVPAGFMKLRLASADDLPWSNDVYEMIARHLGPIYLNNCRQATIGESQGCWENLSAVVISADGDLHKRLHRHRRTGALAHFPDHWGGPLSWLVEDVISLKRWIDTDWEPLPLMSIPEIIEALDRFCASFVARHSNIRCYVVNANQVRPGHFEYDPVLHADAVEMRCRLFNKSLRELSKRGRVRVLDFGLLARQGGLDRSKDIRHVRNDVYTRLGQALAHELGLFSDPVEIT